MSTSRMTVDLGTIEITDTLSDEQKKALGAYISQNSSEAKLFHTNETHTVTLTNDTDKETKHYEFRLSNPLLLQKNKDDSKYRVLVLSNDHNPPISKSYDPSTTSQVEVIGSITLNNNLANVKIKSEKPAHKRSHVLFQTNSPTTIADKEVKEFDLAKTRHKGLTAKKPSQR